MRDDELRERLLDRNPWWRAAAAGGDPTAWVAADQTLRLRAAFDLGHRSRLLDDVATGPVDDKLVVVRGPRRVGKSVLLKDTAARLCGRKDVDARQLIYLPTDGMRASDLNRVTKLGRELTRSVSDAPRIWLLDEVTGIRGWTQALKYLRDNSEFGAETVVCTGSSWDEEGNMERDLLAGRAGRSSNRRSRILHPMSFREVLGVTGRAIPLPVALRPWELHDEAARSRANRSNSSSTTSTSRGRRISPRVAFRGQWRSITGLGRSVRRFFVILRRGSTETSMRMRAKIRCRGFSLR